MQTNDSLVHPLQFSPHRANSRTRFLGHVAARAVLLALLGSATLALRAAPSLGIFQGATDVGAVGQRGNATFEPQSASYIVSGSGENMWFATDAFHFVWREMSGDVYLAASVHWPKAGGNAHRKACLLIRQSLAPDSPYADAVVHGDGLCSLQYRETQGGPTREIQANVSAPARLRLEKEGNFVAMSIASAGESLRPAGGSFQLRFEEPFYVGLGVCAHDNRVLETAVFSDVELSAAPKGSGAAPVLESTLETVAIASKDRRVVHHTRGHFEAPNWSPDGQFFVFNSKGRLYRLARQGGTPELINTDFANRCNNDHGISPDGTRLAISHHGAQSKSRIYTLPISGGTPTEVTPQGPSYWHGWSPDGETLAYCAERNGNFDIYTIPVGGGTETRLTTAEGLDDGPDYSPDGKFVYFNSDRTGLMKIWRMKPDGSNQEQVTQGDLNDWFAHPSPDGKWLVYLSYEKEVKGHPENKPVQLWLQPTLGGPPQVLAKLFGGQGTINVPSWSPDSRHVAFVSYRLK